MRYLTGVIAAAAAVAALSGPVKAKELVYGSWLSPKHSVMRLSLPGYFAAIKKETNGAIAWKIVAGGQLVDGKGTLPAIRDGLIDGGFQIAPYVPRDLPATNMIFSTTVAGENVLAASAAMMETVLLHCPQCIAEYKKNHAVALAGYATTPYMLMCRQPVKTVADLKGLKVRASGGGVYIMRDAGATPVAMSPAGATTALERGALDCVHGSASWLRSFGYQDVAKYLLEYPLGMGGPAMHVFIGRKAWNGMTRAQKQAHIDNAARAVATATILGYMEQDEKVIAAAKKNGLKTFPGGADFKALMDRRLKEQRALNLATARKSHVKNAGAILDAFDASLKKWDGLVKGVGHDVDKYTALMQREIYSKVNPDKI